MFCLFLESHIYLFYLKVKECAEVSDSFHFRDVCSCFLEHDHFFTRFGLGYIFFGERKDLLLVFLFSLLESTDVSAGHDTLRQAQLDQKGISALVPEVKELSNRELAEWQRVQLHLDEVVLILDRQIRNLNRRLRATLAQQFLRCPHQCKVTQLIAPEDDEFNNFD